ncbi:MAG: DUF4118 domain-containing protein [Eubacteriales bacterium]|nr:DUF4118 domain-containing protein [Eubacteriales bacterium]
MDKCKRELKNALFTLLVLSGMFVISYVLQSIFHTQRFTSDLFILGVFLISLKIEGYVWGILAALFSVLAVNFAFTFPYFAFDFIAPESIASAVVMLIVAVLTSTLTTQIKEQEKTRRETEKERMRANLLRGISHDLRTPLTTIYGSCSAIIENYDSLKKERKIKLLGEIREDSEWLIRMVENLLSITKIDGEKVQVIKVPTVLEELIDATLVKFYKRYPNIEVHVEIPDEFISIPMDALLIEQVLMNLLENAVFHARGMSRIDFLVKREGEWAVFYIMDDGCGIMEGKLTKLFDGYLDREEKISDGNRHNMSIGLSVCATIINAHGGTIGAENRKEGGACFSFRLKTEEDDE